MNLADQLEGLLTSARRASEVEELMEEEQVDWAALENRFRDLEQKFERRMRKERDLREQCERLVDALHDCFPVRADLVREDL